MNISNKTFSSLLIVLLLLPIQACALSSGPIEGKVIEEGTNKPIPGAIVIVRWEGHVGYTGTVCYHVESAITDEHGVYRTAAWKEPSPYGDMNYRRQNILAYKPGYEWSTVLPKDPMVLQYLKPFTGGRGERLEYLAKFSGMQCGERANYAKQLLPLYKLIYDEAKNIAVTKEEKRSASNRLRDLEEMEFGYDKAWENWRARARALE